MKKRVEILKLATNGQSDKGFLLTSTFVPKGLSAPVLGLYTCIKALKYIPGPGVRGAFTGPLVLWSATLIRRGSRLMSGLSYWCVRFAASIRKAPFVSYNLNGCFECVLHLCWHKFCQKLCNFRIYFPCISKRVMSKCLVSLSFMFWMVYSYMLVWCSSNCSASIHGWNIAGV